MSLAFFKVPFQGKARARVGELEIHPDHSENGLPRHQILWSFATPGPKSGKSGRDNVNGQDGRPEVGIEA
jgi:hypothetical protein